MTKVLIFTVFINLKQTPLCILNLKKTDYKTPHIEPSHNVVYAHVFLETRKFFTLMITETMEVRNLGDFLKFPSL